MAKECAVCGKKIGFLTGHLDFLDGSVCTKCYEAAGYNSFNTAEIVKMKSVSIEEWKNSQKGEYRKKCKVCGQVFCYTEKDLLQNQRLQNKAVLQSGLAAMNAVGGSRLAGNQHSQRADNAEAQIVDYSKCPNCGSHDLIDATDADIANSNNASVGAQQASSADELKKFKELLDMGVINQEEFDAKKKQLLGL